MPVGEPADDVVQFGHGRVGGRAVGPGPLGGVIEVRQIDIEEVGLPLPRGEHGRVGDPRARLDVGHRPPVVHQRKVAQARRAVRRRVPSAACSTRATPSRRDCGSGRACRRNRPRSPCCAAETRRPRSAASVVREQVPDLRPLDAVVRRGPHLHLPLVAPIEPVGHDAVFAGRLPVVMSACTGQVTQGKLGRQVRRSRRRPSATAASASRPRLFHASRESKEE